MKEEITVKKLDLDELVDLMNDSHELIKTFQKSDIIKLLKILKNMYKGEEEFIIYTALMFVKQNKNKVLTHEDFNLVINLTEKSLFDYGIDFEIIREVLNKVKELLK